MKRDFLNPPDLPDWGTFFGGRVGLRANGQTSLGTARLVFEIGAGIW